MSTRRVSGLWKGRKRTQTTARFAASLTRLTFAQAHPKDEEEEDAQPPGGSPAGVQLPRSEVAARDAGPAAVGRSWRLPQRRLPLEPSHGVVPGSFPRSTLRALLAAAACLQVWASPG